MVCSEILTRGDACNSSSSLLNQVSVSTFMSVNNQPKQRNPEIPRSLTVQMKSMVVFVESPSFFNMSNATANVKDAPLPPATKMTLSATLAKFGIAPYGPSIEARREAPGCFEAYVCRSFVKPSHAATTNSREVDVAETIVNGCVSMARIFGTHKKQWVPGTALAGARRRTIRVPPFGRGVIVARLLYAYHRILPALRMRSEDQMAAAKIVIMMVLNIKSGRCKPTLIKRSIYMTMWVM